MDKTAIKKILIVELGGIGDIILSGSALRALRQTFPDAKISLLVTGRSYDFVKKLPYIDQVFKFYVTYGGKQPLAGIFHNFKTLFYLRSLNFDVAVNMRSLISKNSVKKIKLLFDIVNPGMSVGRDTEGMGGFFDKKIKESIIGKKHEIDYICDLLTLLGVEVKDKNVELRVEQKSEKEVKKILEQHNISENDLLIGIHPGGRPSRRWPKEKFVELINKLSKELSCRVVLTAGRSETALSEAIKSKSEVDIINLGAQINLDELIALIKRCDCYVSNDTGPMHIAAVLKAPLVAIFGAGDVTHYDPRFISNKAIVLKGDAECYPCNRVECDMMKCYDNIKVEDVLGAVKNLLQEKS